MPFELSDALIDSILFAMEDQNGEYFFDTKEEAFIPSEDAMDVDMENLVDLPEWGPSSGFQLMEHFTAGLRNPVVREELSRALSRGRGVFRAFKDILSAYPEIEKRWFQFKEKEMKREILDWYNALREGWGLEKIGGEPEDTEDMVLEDFIFRPGMESDREAAEKLHRDCGEEYKDSGGAEICNGMTPWAFPGDISLVTETANGDFAAYACARRLPEKSEAGPASSGETLSRLHITALEVRREYRGLGIGEELLRRLLETGAAEKNTLVSLDLPAGAEGFARVLLRESFKPQVVRYCRTGPVQ